VLADWRRVQARAPVAADVDAGPSDASAPVERIALDRALATLDPGDREVLLLRELGGLDYAEIAEFVESTHAAVRSRLYRARVAIRADLEPAAVLPFSKQRQS